MLLANLVVPWEPRPQVREDLSAQSYDVVGVGTARVPGERRAAQTLPVAERHQACIKVWFAKVGRTKRDTQAS